MVIWGYMGLYSSEHPSLNNIRYSTRHDSRHYMVRNRYEMAKSVTTILNGLEGLSYA